jgi:hypothetical protein
MVFIDFLKSTLAAHTPRSDILAFRRPISNTPSTPAARFLIIDQLVKRFAALLA